MASIGGNGSTKYDEISFRMFAIKNKNTKEITRIVVIVTWVAKVVYGTGVRKVAIATKSGMVGKVALAISRTRVREVELSSKGRNISRVLINSNAARVIKW